MARGNLAISRNFCPSCNGMVKFERNDMVWGLGDFVMVFVTFLLWVPLKFVFHAMNNPWRCSTCGSRPGKG